MTQIIRSLFLIFILLVAGPIRAEGDSLRVQLQWYHQSQFAGFYVAEARKHFYEEGLDVEILARSTDEDPISILQSGRADIAVSNLNNAYGSLARGPSVTNVAQIFERSGLQVLCRISQGVVRPTDVIGKKIGVWGIGDENLVASMLARLDIPLDQVEIIRQRPDGKDLIDGSVQCATAMSYNESVSVLNAGIPISDLILLRPEQFDLANIEDGLYVLTERLDDPQFRAALVRFIRALRKGWDDARIAPTVAVEAVLRTRPDLDRQFQHRMLEEILSLIPEDHERFGILDLKQLDQQATQMKAHASGMGWVDQIWTYQIIEDLLEEDGLHAPFTAATIYYVNQFVSNSAFIILVFFGVFAYALTGVLEAINRGYDIWGRIVLAMLSGVGGGTLRDLIIGIERQPFYYVLDPTYPIGILLVVLVVSLFVWLKPDLPNTKGFKVVKSYSDMLGFTFLAITGAVISVSADMPWFWAPICAALTCAGGGMLRDIVINREPVTFRGVVYEEVAVLGGLFVVFGLFISNYFEHSPEPVWLSVGGAMVLVFVMKWLIHHYHWRYPVRARIV